MKWSGIFVGFSIFFGIAAVAGGLTLLKYRAIQDSIANAVQYEPQETVEVAPVQEIQWQPYAELVGTVFSLRSVRMSNELPGRIVDVRFESGEIVDAGTVLVSLDDSSDQAERAVAEALVKVAEAAITSAEVRVKLADIEYERLRNAADVRAVSQMDLDRARAEVDASRADLARLNAELTQARARVHVIETRLDKMVLRAPFRARAGIRRIHEGQFLDANSDIVTLEEVSESIYLDFAIPQEYIARVRPGFSVMASSQTLGPDPVVITVVAVDASVNDLTRNIRVRAMVNNKDDRLRPGMFLRVQVPSDEPQPRLMIPGTAIRRASHADHVFVVLPESDQSGHRAQLRYVKLGPSVGEQVIILEGLSPNELVATSGSFKLMDGIKVHPVAPAALSPSTQASAR